ncbi:MAG: DUF4255 domain-containing protein [Pseudomonadota bacterium]
MIDTAINHIASELNQYLKRTFDQNEDLVVVSNILEQDGTVATHVNNKIVISLVNIEKDSVPFRQQSIASVGGGRAVINAQPVFFNLYLMFASCFSASNYNEGLKFISNTIGFFQEQPVLDRKSTPALDKNIEKLIVEIENLNMQDLSNLWGVLSGKYLPSVMYKVKMVTYDSNAIIKQTPILSQTKQSVNH